MPRESNTIKVDKLERCRKAVNRDSNVFFNWVRTNCTKAVSAEETRKLSQNIKKPFRKILKDT